MRILLASEWFTPDVGGVASHVRDLAINLARRGHEVAILTRKKQGRERSVYNLIELEQVEYFKIFHSLSGNGILKNILNIYNPDVVHAHHAFTPIPLITLRVASVNGFSTVLTNHSAYFYDYDYLLKTLGYIVFPIRTVLRKVDKVIAVSSVAAKFIGSFVSSSKISIIPNGVDTLKFKPYGSRIYRENFDSDFVILYVGRLVHRKGVHLLVESMSYLKKEIPDAKLVIAGSGPLFYTIIEKIEANNLRDRVILLGKVSDEELPDLYRSADVFVLPSIYGESFGIVVLEAMASGLPVVASAVGGVKELIKNRENGLLLDNKTPPTIAGHLIELYQDCSLRRKLASKARETAVKKFDWRIISAKIEKVYEETIEKRLNYAITK